MGKFPDLNFDVPSNYTRRKALRTLSLVGLGAAIAIIGPSGTANAQYPYPETSSPTPVDISSIPSERFTSLPLSRLTQKLTSAEDNERSIISDTVHEDEHPGLGYSSSFEGVQDKPFDNATLLHINPEAFDSQSSHTGIMNFPEMNEFRIGFSTQLRPDQGRGTSLFVAYQYIPNKEINPDSSEKTYLLAFPYHPGRPAELFTGIVQKGAREIRYVGINGSYGHIPTTFLARIVCCGTM